jgi:hypothetical protein
MTDSNTSGIAMHIASRLPSFASPAAITASVFLWVLLCVCTGCSDDPSTGSSPLDAGPSDAAVDATGHADAEDATDSSDTFDSSEADAPDSAVDADEDTGPTCGDGLVTHDEECDTEIAAGEAGACPTTCGLPEDVCTSVTLEGNGCQASCQEQTIDQPADGDGCCPDGASADEDDDCQPAGLVGAPQTVCSAGTYRVSTLAAGGGAFAVGCAQSGSQQMTPTVRILDGSGAELASHSLRNADAYYYLDIGVYYNGGRFQTMYQYNCDDNGSWNDGWGWGCVDFREYDTTGAEVTSSLVYGEIGHSGHPVLAYDGSGFGTAFVSYDELHFRYIDASRQLSGGGKADNPQIGSDPNQGDDRDANRTEIVWDEGVGEFAIFTILDSQLYYARADASGTATQTLTHLGAAYSQIFGGQFDAIYLDGAYYVVYLDNVADPATVNLIKIARDGTVSESATVLSGVEFRYPAMIEVDSRLYVFSHDDNGHGQMHVYDQNLQLDAPRSGLIGGGHPMTYPVPAYDASNQTWAVIYLDASEQVVFQNLAMRP